MRWDQLSSRANESTIHLNQNNTIALGILAITIYSAISCLNQSHHLQHEYYHDKSHQSTSSRHKATFNNFPSQTTHARINTPPRINTHQMSNPHSNSEQVSCLISCTQDQPRINAASEHHLTHV